jgi:hypothetical protein
LEQLADDSRSAPAFGGAPFEVGAGRLVVAHHLVEQEPHPADWAHEGPPAGSAGTCAWSRPAPISA